MSKNCIICDNDKSELWGTKGKYSAVRCSNCGLVWIDPLPSYDELERFYNGYLNNRIENDVLWKQRQQMYVLERDFLEQFISRGKVLDLGCGDGGFLGIFSEKWEKFGIELENAAVISAKSKNINAYQGSPEDGINFSNLFDCVILRGVLEHFINPEKVIQNVAKSLDESGFLYITSTPDVNSFCANLYRGKWNQFEPPAHLFYFGINNLKELCEKHNMNLLVQHHFYLETPYADPSKDHAKVLNDLSCYNEGLDEKVTKSPAFWGNMMSLIFKKYS